MPPSARLGVEFLVEIMEKTLRAPREVILDSINEGVFTVDLSWRITSFNRAAQLITGKTAKQAIGSFCWDVFHADICQAECALKKIMDSEKSMIRAKAHIIHRSGNKIPISVSAAILHDQDDRIIGGVETFQDLSRIERLKKELHRKYTYKDMVGKSKAMRNLFAVLPRVAESESTVLIEGGSGTGKELVARAIHNLSPRSARRMVAVNCAALPDNLLESELFGYEAGAFTDARKKKPGRFTIADRGTIFLDEIGDISPAMQVKLLRVLEDRCVEPLGSVESVPVDVRVLAATNQDLAGLVKEGAFREDLYYRIKVVHMELPTLRERREDIPILIDHIIAKLNQLRGSEVVGVTPKAMVCLLEHDYPGNVRELENIIEQGLVLCREGLLDVQHLPAELWPFDGKGLSDSGPISLKEMEKMIISQTLKNRKGNRTLSAQDLGIDPSTLYRKIKKLGVQTPAEDGRVKKD